MRALGQLTGGIAHDFNNLLGVIIGSVEILADAVRDMPEYAELAHEILNSALSGSLPTRRLLAVGRNQPLQPQRIDLGPLVRREAEMLRRTLGERIQIETLLAPDLWCTSADPSQIGDALLNLALNAQHALPEGGELILTTRCSGTRAILDVIDTGVGMTEAVRARIFDPFFSTRKGGSGLGLPTTRKIVEAHGGTIEVRSDPGKGSQFSIQLPLCEGHPHADRGVLEDGSLPSPTSLHA